MKAFRRHSLEFLALNHHNLLLLLLCAATLSWFLFPELFYKKGWTPTVYNCRRETRSRSDEYLTLFSKLCCIQTSTSKPDLLDSSSISYILRGGPGWERLVDRRRETFVFLMDIRRFTVSSGGEKTLQLVRVGFNWKTEEKWWLISSVLVRMPEDWPFLTC